MSSSLSAIRQAAAEVLAYSLSSLFPGILFAENEVSESGFFYDVCLQQEISDEIIPLLEERMRACVKEAIPITCMDMMRENAMAYFAHLKQPYKAELLQGVADNVVKVYKMGEFADLCHVEPFSNTEEVQAFKILKIESAKASLPSSKHLPVVRIHGTAFANKMDLKKFLKKYEAAKRRDHRLLGQEMRLFTFNEKASPGFLFWQPKGAALRQFLQDFWRKLHPLTEYQPIQTPRFAELAFLKKFYGKRTIQENFELEGNAYASPPNRELLHALIFKMSNYSSLDLPVRYTEWEEKLHDVKNTGLWGLFRSRSQLIDTASIFCSTSQVYKELISSLHFIDKTIKIFGIEHRWFLSSKGQKVAGNLESWNQGYESLAKALEECSIDYSLDKVDSAFYGPCIEVRLVDAIGREWRGPHLGLNVNYPEQLGVQYKGPNDTLHVPIMITRSLFGALELFMGILIEQYAGVLPLWMAPEQLRVISVSEKNSEYAEKIYKECVRLGFRTRIDLQNGNLGAKVHAAELEKIPYLIIIGDREEKQGSITVRRANEEAKKMEIGPFLDQLLEEEKEKTFV